MNVSQTVIRIRCTISRSWVSVWCTVEVQGMLELLPVPTTSLLSPMLQPHWVPCYSAVQPWSLPISFICSDCSFNLRARPCSSLLPLFLHALNTSLLTAFCVQVSMLPTVMNKKVSALMELRPQRGYSDKMGGEILNSTQTSNKTRHVLIGLGFSIKTFTFIIINECPFIIGSLKTT